MHKTIFIIASLMLLLFAFVLMWNYFTYHPDLEEPMPPGMLPNTKECLSEPDAAFKRHDPYVVLADSLEEAVFTVLLKKSLLNRNENRPYYIGLPSGTEPSDHLIAVLRKLHIRTYKEPECYNAPRSSAITDRKTHEHGTLFFISKVVWLDDNTADVSCGYYMGNLAAGGQTFRVELLKNIEY